MSNLTIRLKVTDHALRAFRVAERAGAEDLGASLHELQPGDEIGVPDA